MVSAISDTEPVTKTITAWIKAVTINTENEITSALIPRELLSRALSIDSAGSWECIPNNSLSPCLIPDQNEEPWSWSWGWG